MTDEELKENSRYIWKNYPGLFIVFLTLCIVTTIIMVVGIRNSIKEMSIKPETKQSVEMTGSIPTLAFGFLKEKKVNVVTRYSEFNGAILCDYDETTLLISFQNKLFYINRQQVVWVREAK